MKTYQIQIKEILEMTVIVEAENVAQAKENVKQKWGNGDYVLGADNFQDVMFSIRRKK